MAERPVFHPALAEPVKRLIGAERRIYALRLHPQSFESKNTIFEIQKQKDELFYDLAAKRKEVGDGGIGVTMLLGPEETLTFLSETRVRFEIPRGNGSVVMLQTRFNNILGRGKVQVAELIDLLEPYDSKEEPADIFFKRTLKEIENVDQFMRNTTAPKPPFYLLILTKAKLGLRMIAMAGANTLPQGVRITVYDERETHDPAVKLTITQENCRKTFTFEIPLNNADIKWLFEAFLRKYSEKHPIFK